MNETTYYVALLKQYGEGKENTVDLRLRCKANKEENREKETSFVGIFRV